MRVRVGVPTPGLGVVYMRAPEVACTRVRARECMRGRAADYTPAPGVAFMPGREGESTRAPRPMMDTRGHGVLALPASRARNGRLKIARGEGGSIAVRPPTAEVPRLQR